MLIFWQVATFTPNSIIASSLQRSKRLSDLPRMGVEPWASRFVKDRQIHRPRGCPAPGCIPVSPSPPPCRSWCSRCRFGIFLPGSFWSFRTPCSPLLVLSAASGLFAETCRDSSFFTIENPRGLTRDTTTGMPFRCMKMCRHIALLHHAGNSPKTHQIANHLKIATRTSYPRWICRCIVKRSQQASLYLWRSLPAASRENGAPSADCGGDRGRRANNQDHLPLRARTGERAGLRL